MALISTDYPEGHPTHGKTFAISGTAKADGLRFQPWAMVKAMTDRQERQIAAFAREHNIPVRVFDWQDEALVAEYFRRHPGEVPAPDASGMPDVTAVARLIARTVTPDVPAKQIPQLSPDHPEAIPASPGRHRPADARKTRGPAEEKAAAEAAAAAQGAQG